MKSLKNWMKYIVLVPAVGMLLLLMACLTTNNNDRSLEDLYRHMVKETNCAFAGPVEPGLAHAVAGFAVKIAGRDVYFYKYDTSVKEGRMARKYQFVKDNGFIYLAGFKFSAAVNGSFIMVDYDTNEQKELLLKAFKSF